MAVRNDFSVNFELSPRLVDVTSTSSEISVQDSHDTLTNIQDSPEGGQFDFLVSTAGGEDLGGGTTVGLTTVLNNTQYAFQSTSPIESGTVTTADTTTLIDSAATFQTNNVKRGDWIINFTDQSVTEILTVVSETEVTTRGLRDGTLNTFSMSDAYKIWEVTDAELAGGNFTAIDDVSADLNPVFPVFGRTFKLTASSSATATSQRALESGLLAGVVVIDTVSGYSGTESNMLGNLIGTRLAPSNNTADAIVIAANNGIRKFILAKSLTLSSVDFSEGYTFTSDNAVLVLLAIDPGANVVGCQFENLTISGTLDGGNTIKDSSVSGLTYVNGFIHRSALSGTVTVAPGSKALLIDCFSNILSGQPAVLDMGLTGELELTNFNGELTITNFTGGPSTLEIFMNSGKLVVDSTVTGGNIHVYGSAIVIDNSTGTANIVNDTLDNRLDGARYTHRSVFIDTESPTNGDGSAGSPFNDPVAAKDFAELKGYKNLVVFADMVIDRNMKNFIIQGVGNPVIDCNGQDINKTQFFSCRLSGTYTGVIHAERCELANGFSLNGKFLSCGLDGDLTCVDTAVVLLKDCASTIAGTGRPTISLNAAGTAKLSVRGNQGGLTIKDGNNVLDAVTVENMGGSLTFDASNTAATMVARGVGKFVDLATDAGATVIDECQIHRTWQRLDLDTSKPNVYTEDVDGRLTTIVNDDFTLTSTKVGNDTTVQRS